MKRRNKISSGRGALISHRSHLSLTSLIRQNLGDDNMNTLLSSCFRHLFFMNSIKFQGQLYNLLLRSLDKPSLTRNRLSFCICGRILDFSPRDFALITGLKFNEWYDTPVESEIHRSVFSKKQSISLGDIIQAFKKECSASGGTSTMSLRLGFLVLLYGVLLVVGGKNNSIDMSYMHLIDDIDKFNVFPWGSVAYMCLVKRTHRAREVLENIIMNDKKLAFDANGFVIALQIWAYEVVPMLSRNCATRIEGSDSLFPRMRKWSAMNHLKFDLLNKLILKSLPESLVTMNPCASEEDYIKNLGVDEFDDALVSHINEDNQPPFRKKARLISTEKLTGEVGSYTEQMKNLKSPAVMSHEVEFLAKRMADLQQCMMSVCKMQMVNEENDKKDGSMTSPTKAFPDDKLQNTPLPSKRTGLRSGDAKMCKKVGTTPPAYKRSGCRSGETSSKMSTGKILNEHVTCKKVEKRVLTQRYDPNEPTFKGNLMKTFENWRGDSKNNAASGRLVLPLFKGLPVDVDWFHPLWSRRGWFETEHIDALLNLITLKWKSDPSCVCTDWTFMEMLCWGALTSDNENLVRDRVGPYLCGLQPRQGHLYWARARKVFGVGHINGDHWVSFEVSLDECRITVFDSNSKSSSWSDVEPTFKLVARNLGKILQDLHIWEFRGISAVDRHWAIVPYGNPPQQVNNADCGVLAIKFIECLVTGCPVDNVDSSRCGVFRHSYAKQIFDLAIPDTTTVELDSD